MSTGNMNTEPARANQFHFRAVIMCKESMIGLIGLATTSEGAARTTRYDERFQPPILIGPYEEVSKVIKDFVTCLRKSQRNGWELVYQGQPLYG